MEKTIRIIVGLGVVAISVWLAVMIERPDGSASEVLPQNYPEAYADSLGERASAEYDSTLNSRPHLLMKDGSLTLNDVCPVLGSRLNRRVQPVFVNDAPVGFC